MLEWGSYINADFYQLYFDQNEPFCGHVQDRLKNKRSKRDLGPEFVRRIAHCGESDSRLVPALQAADLLAWCEGQPSVRFDWQKRVLAIEYDRERLDYAEMSDPRDTVSEYIKAWKLPRRKPTR
jgi:hypothetical protein